jgi:hypothetical protein
VTADDLRDTITTHFRAPDRQAVIRVLGEFPNFFEEWFRAETLFALRRRWPQAKLISNENYREFRKPDVVVGNGSFTAVLALKHTATRYREAQSRWNGGKDSTVAKDILNLRAVRANGESRRVLVFYGPGRRVAHNPGAICGRNRLSCISCSVADLCRVLVANGADRIAEPEIVTLLDDGSFHLLDFAV